MGLAGQGAEGQHKPPDAEEGQRHAGQEDQTQLPGAGKHVETTDGYLYGYGNNLDQAEGGPAADSTQIAHGTGQELT